MIEQISCSESRHNLTPNTVLKTQNDHLNPKTIRINSNKNIHLQVKRLITQAQHIFTYTFMNHIKLETPAVGIKCSRFEAEITLTLKLPTGISEN